MLKIRSKMIVVVLMMGSGIALLHRYKGDVLQEQQCGIVVLLDGTSSVGKSAIIGEFKKSHPEYSVIKVDDWYPGDLIKKAEEYGWEKSSSVSSWVFVREYLTEKNKRYYLDTELRGELFGQQKERGYLEEAKKLALEGQKVIIDTVLEDAVQYRIFEETFEKIPTKKVLVYCPLDILLDRVEKRNQSSDAAEHRTSFLSFEQFSILYKVQATSEEKVVDVVSSAVIKQALEKSIEDLFAFGLPSVYSSVIEDFKRKFIARFGLDEQEEIRLVAARPYDLVINSGVYSPRELAGQI